MTWGREERHCVQVADPQPCAASDQIVKDHCAKFQVSDVDQILCDDPNEFIKRYLMQKALGKLSVGDDDSDQDIGKIRG